MNLCAPEKEVKVLAVQSCPTLCDPIKGTFHAKIGSIKDRNGMDLTEAEDTKKRWQEYTEELYKKDLHDPDNHDGVTLIQSQTSWNVKSSGPQEVSL